MTMADEPSGTDEHPFTVCAYCGEPFCVGLLPIHLEYNLIMKSGKMGSENALMDALCGIYAHLLDFYF